MAKFLRKTLANGPALVSEIEALARAAGLIGNAQRITHAKLFKTAKKSLGIRSVRNGFGSGGEWLWLLEKQPAPPVAEPPPAAAPRIPLGWIEGIACLDYHRPFADVPPHRWRQFVDDCNNFLASDQHWAERAARLGWGTVALFGCCRNRPLSRLTSAGLMWAVNGGRLVELHRDWAVIAINGSGRIFQRRRVDAADVTLPWIGV